MNLLTQLRKDVQKEGDPKKAQFLGRFFKTGKDQYAAGDVFLGLTVPQSRLIVKKYRDLPLKDVLELLTSKFHEERLIALLIMVSHFARTSPRLRPASKASRDKYQFTQKEIFDAYLANTKYINNWDLVDLSAEHIVGEHLLVKGEGQRAKSVLEELAGSKDLWEKRIAIIATFAFIKHGEHEMTFTIADILLHDSHDLIHKAVGWMLREVGKRISQDVEEKFLKTRYKTMPRTMLRYAIERFEEGKRERYLLGMI